MALEFDIKANDEFSASINDAADGLLRTAKYEGELNAMTDKLGRAYKEAAGYAQNMSQRTREAIGATSLLYGNSEKIAQIGKTDRSKLLAAVNKEYAVQKKENVERKKWLDIVKTGAKGIAEMGAALVASAAAAAALAYKLADAGKGAFEARREAGALLDAWTGQRGPKALQLIDGLAQKIGMSFTEARAKFLEFREAGLNNKLSAKLLKIRQDLIALGLSAENADKEVSRVTSVGHDPYARIRAIKELEHAYRGVGSGAFAAYHAIHSVDGAQVRIGNATNEALVQLWKQISPAVGDASNRLADFLVNLMKSEKGQAAINSLAESIQNVASAFNAQNFERALKVLEVGGRAVSAVWKAAFVYINGVAKAFELVAKLFTSDESKNAAEAGKSVVGGFVSGIDSVISKGDQAVLKFAKSLKDTFSGALGIQSPSKVFAEYGRQTVAGYERGQMQALGAGEMPIERAAQVAPERPAQLVRSSTVNNSQTTQSGPSIVIEHLTVEGGTNATADDVSRAIRRELQLLLNAGALSRGYT